MSSDTRPSIGMVAGLQKGLRLSYRGKELIGEGAGFGVPVLIYPDRTYFSGSSYVLLHRCNRATVIRKEFYMDRVNRREFRGIGLNIRKTSHLYPLIRMIYRFVAKIYMKFQHWLLFPLTGISVKLGLRTNFIQAPTAGKVVVTYQVDRNKIKVRTDFSAVKRDTLRTVIILNELGSRYLHKYSDSQEKELTEGQIYEWSEVRARFARITDQSGRFGFKLRRKKGSIMYRGREFVKSYLDWIGLDYALRPETNAFAYQIEIFGGSLKK